MLFFLLYFLFSDCFCFLFFFVLSLSLFPLHWYFLHIICYFLTFSAMPYLNFPDILVLPTMYCSFSNNQFSPYPFDTVLHSLCPHSTDLLIIFFYMTAFWLWDNVTCLEKKTKKDLTSWLFHMTFKHLWSEAKKLKSKKKKKMPQIDRYKGLLIRFSRRLTK